MFGYVGQQIEYQVNFPAAKAGLATIGYQLKSGGVNVGARVTAGIFENGHGSYGVKITHAEPFSGSIIWDTGDADIKRAREEVNIVQAPAVSVDLSPVMAELQSSTHGLAANMALLAVAADEVDVIHGAIGSLGAALSAGLATETTQAAILELLTIPDYDGPVVTVPASPAAGLQTVYGLIGDSAGAVVEDVTVTAELSGPNRSGNEFLQEQVVLESTTGVNGQWALILVQGCKYIVRIPRHSKEYHITITTAGVATLASYLPGGA